VKFLMPAEILRRETTREFWIAVGLSLFAALAFYFTTKAMLQNFDYTGPIASALLQGYLGLERHPGSWLNELVPWEGKYDSAFPLGAVFSIASSGVTETLGAGNSLIATRLSCFPGCFFCWRVTVR